MINLLFIAKDTTSLIIKNYSYLEAELRKITNLMLWRESGDIKDILDQVPAKPDFILILNDLAGFGPIVNGLSDINIPSGLFVNDAHRFGQIRREYINENNIRYLFSVVRNLFFKKYSHFKDRFIWFPHFINPEIYRDYGLEKQIDMLMIGAVNKGYPLRMIIKNYYQTNPNFVYRSHPGYKPFSKEIENQLLIGDNYAKEINKAKIFFTCDSVLKYPLLKYFEVPACKTLLLAPTFLELEDLGFIPSTHFVPINESDFAHKANYYLENEEERNRIIQQGHDFILQNHTVEIRAKQLVENIETILKKAE
jgi:hypothetical protein